MNNTNYADVYIDFMDNHVTDESTVNDFFKFAKIKKKQRSEFLFAAILKQAQEKIKGK